MKRSRGGNLIIIISRGRAGKKMTLKKGWWSGSRCKGPEFKLQHLKKKRPVFPESLPSGGRRMSTLTLSLHKAINNLAKDNTVFLFAYSFCSRGGEMPYCSSC
jgi:hypothetical protein